MNRIFKDPLALHGYPLPFESTETIAERKAADAAAFGTRYGNRTAARRLFGATAGAGTRASKRGAVPQEHGCTLGACG